MSAGWFGIGPINRVGQLAKSPLGGQFHTGSVIRTRLELYSFV
jgi:hypothetical protein